MGTDKPQPGQWVFVPLDYPSTDPAGVLFGLAHQVIEPGEFEEDGEITVDVDGVEYYLKAARVRVVPPPAADPA